MEIIRAITEHFEAKKYDVLSARLTVSLNAKVVGKVAVIKTDFEVELENGKHNLDSMKTETIDGVIYTLKDSHYANRGPREFMKLYYKAEDEGVGDDEE